MEYILQQSRILILNNNSNNDINIINKKSRDLIIRFIGCFISVSLPLNYIDKMSRYMLEQIELISCKLLNFKHYYSLYFTSNELKSRLYILQCALHRRFPLLNSEGCASLTRIPIFYGTKQSSLFRSYNIIINQKTNNNNNIQKSVVINEKDRIGWELLQTSSSFKTIPCRHLENINHPFPSLTMDIKSLEQEIERDENKGKLPCVVFASHIDNILKIKQICDRFGLWLHIEGGSSSVLLAASTQLPKTTKIMLNYADSISFKPYESWFNDYNINDGSINDSNNDSDKDMFRIENKKTLTFIKEDFRDTIPPVYEYNNSDFNDIFPMWYLFNHLNIDLIRKTVDNSLKLCSSFKIELNDKKDVFQTALSPGSVIPHVLLFQICPLKKIINLNMFNLDINTFHGLLIKVLNKYINNIKGLNYKIYQNQTCFVYEPLKYYLNNSNNNVNEDDIKNEYNNIKLFVTNIVDEIKLLKVCYEKRQEFISLLNNDTELFYINPNNVANFVGLITFQYIPIFLQTNNPDNNGDTTNDNIGLINSLNKTLYNQLSQNNNNIYKLTLSANEYECITINATKSDDISDIKALHSHIKTTIKTMKYPESIMNELSSIIKVGIESAQTNIDNKIYNEYNPDNLIRSVPVVGSVYGWFLPKNNDKNNIDSLSFDLVSNTLQQNNFDNKN